MLIADGLQIRRNGVPIGLLILSKKCFVAEYPVGLNILLMSVKVNFPNFLSTCLEDIVILLSMFFFCSFCRRLCLSLPNWKILA